MNTRLTTRRRSETRESGNGAKRLAATNDDTRREATTMGFLGGRLFFGLDGDSFSPTENTKKLLQVSSLFRHPVGHESNRLLRHVDMTRKIINEPFMGGSWATEDQRDNWMVSTMMVGDTIIP